MAANNCDLFYLVKGLSGNEKSYYKKMAKRHSADNQALHLKLFDIIDRSREQDEKKFMKQLGINSAAQFSSLKNYLSRDMLDAIVFQKRNDSISIRLHFLRIQIEQLLEKKLLVLARRLFAKAWEMATFYEQFGTQLELLQMQGRLLEHKSYKEYKAEAATIAENLQVIIQQQQQLQQLHILTEQLQSLKRNTPLRYTEAQLQDVRAIKESLSQLTGTMDSLRLKWLYLTARASAEHMLQQYDDCLYTGNLALQLVKLEPRLIQIEPEYFLQLCNTVFYNDFATSSLSSADEHLSLLQELADKQLYNDYFRQRWHIIAFNTSLKLAHKKADYETVASYLKEANKILSFARQVLAPADQLSIMCSLCISWFVLEEWNNAEDLMMEIKEMNREINREDVLYFSLVFHLLILYEKREWYRLDSSTEAAYHMLYARKKLRPFEKELMLFLKRLPLERSKTGAARLIKGFLEKLDTFKNDPVQHLYFLYFNYYGWLESKIQGLRYRDYRKQQVAQLNEKAQLSLAS